MQYRNLLTHHIDACYPFARVTSESVILSRALDKPTWSEEAVTAWCGEQGRAGVQLKAELPPVRSRDVEVALVQEWVRKKPAMSKKQRIKRTPFSGKRQHQFVAVGVKKSS